MLSFCLKCNEKTDSQNLRVAKKKTGRIVGL